MNVEEYKKIQGLKNCRFLPGSYQKAFVRTLSTLEEADNLTPKQSHYLDRVYYLYREQINVLREKGYDLPIPFDPDDDEVQYNDES